MNENIFLGMLGIGFAAWAGVVGWGVSRVTQQIDQIGADVRRLAEQMTHEVQRIDRVLGVVQRQTENLETQYKGFLSAVKLAMRGEGE
jgi:hypothetical protein